MSAPEPTAEPTAKHIAEAHRIAPIDCPVGAITRIAHALAAAEARGFERGRREERAAVVAWLRREETECHKQANAAQDNGSEMGHQRYRAQAQANTYAAMEIARGSHVAVRHDAPKEPR